MLSIYGCDALEVPVVFAKVEGVELGGSLEVPVVLVEVKGVEPGEALAVVVMADGVERSLFGFGN